MESYRTKSETPFNRKYMLDADEWIDGKCHTISNINLIDLMYLLEFIAEYYNDRINTLNVVWDSDASNDDVNVLEIYDGDTGEVHWENPEPMYWTDKDETLVNSLIMWGSLEHGD